MALIMGQATVPASATVPIFEVPPGVCNVTIYNVNASTASVYVGSSTAVSSANGLICHSLPTNFFTYVGSRGTELYATTGGAVASSLNYIISTGA